MKGGMVELPPPPMEFSGGGEGEEHWGDGGSISLLPGIKGTGVCPPPPSMSDDTINYRDSARFMASMSPNHNRLKVEGDCGGLLSNHNKKKTLKVELDSQFQNSLEFLEEDQPSPKCHPIQEPPVCNACVRKDINHFNTQCDSCWYTLKKSILTPSQVFAVLRHCEARVQKNVGPLVGLAVRGGCGINDRDAVTDMTLLHYAVKAGAKGLGDPEVAVQVVEELLLGGADIHLRCKWSQMTSLHYAAFFDVPLVIELLAHNEKGVHIDDPCSEYNGATPLHLAAANMCLSAARVLVHHGADISIKDKLGRTPADCIPDPEQYKIVPDFLDIIGELKRFLGSSSGGLKENPYRCSSPGSHGCSVGGSAGGDQSLLSAMGLKLGDRVMVNGLKTGTLRFVGSTEFAMGLWAGVELETGDGKHNGTFQGVVYFRCSSDYGVFVPATRITKIPNVSRGRLVKRRRPVSQRQKQKNAAYSSCERIAALKLRSASLPPDQINRGKVDVSKIGSKVAQDIKDDTRKIIVNDRVVVDLRILPSTAQRQSSPLRYSRLKNKSSGDSQSDSSPTSSSYKLNQDSNRLKVNSLTPSISQGTVKFVGTVGFASGYWIGIDLDDAIGRNDGSVNNIQYFECRPQHGIFVSACRVVKIKHEDKDDSSHIYPYVEELFNRANKILPKNKSTSCLNDTTKIAQKQISGGKVIKNDKQNDVNRNSEKINRKCLSRNKSLDSISALKYYNNPTNQKIVSPFRYNPNRKLIRRSSYSDSDGDNSGSSSADSEYDHLNGETNSEYILSGVLGDYSVSSGLAVFANNGMNFSLKNEFYPTNTTIANLNKSFSARYVSSRLRMEEMVRKKELRKQEPIWVENSKVKTPTKYNPQYFEKQGFDEHWLDIGSNVFYRGKIGTLKFIGTVDFEDGIWLGIELKRGVGRHDGAVFGRRYFTCKPNKGVMVKPANVTVRGINAAELIREDTCYDEEFWI